MKPPMKSMKNARFARSRKWMSRVAWPMSATIVMAIAFAAALGAAVPGDLRPRQQDEQMSPNAAAQIDALIREKESRTGVNLKIDSQLIYHLRMSRGQRIAEDVIALETGVRVESDNRIILDVTATVTDRLLTDFRTLGVEVMHGELGENSLRVRAAAAMIETIASLPDVQFVQPKQQYLTLRMPKAPQPISRRFPLTGDPSRSAFGKPFSRSEFAAAVARAGAGGRAVAAMTGSVTSEGDITHRAAAARAAFHVDGTGVKVGVLSDGVTHLSASQALGDLGTVTVLTVGGTVQTGSGDEGTAMLEIVHDLAPGAQLFFATADNSMSSFAANIRALRTAGCDIIVDDVYYFPETPFQDGQATSVNSNTNGGIIAQAVKDVSAAGALYFSAAGNSGNLDANNSGTWEGDFVDGGAAAAPLTSATTSRVHNFGSQNYDVQTLSGGSGVNLYWSDPLGGSSNDYDLFVLNSTGTQIVGASTNIQSGSQDPYESVNSAPSGSRIVIVKKASAAGRFLHLSTLGGTLTIATAGEIHGHAATSAANSFGVAATPAAAPGGNSVAGPYPNAFSSINTVEAYSSDGPRRIFFNNDGSVITPGNVSSTGGQVLNKPDVTAADGVSVSGVGGFGSPFYGTSAAAPHAAAIAALVKSANAALTPAQIRSALINTAIDIQAAGVDRDSGWGIVMADGAVSVAGGTAVLALGAPNATENPGNGNGVINNGEGAKMFLPITNQGLVSATGITATLTSSTPGITVTLPGTATYPDLASGAAATNTVPFTFTVGPTVPCPLTVAFTLTLSYSGGPSPNAISFQLPLGLTYTITTTLDSVAPLAPLASLGVATSTGVQTGRLNRGGTASSCATSHAGALNTSTGSRQYDAYAFPLCAEATTSCASISLTSAGGANLYTAAYSPTFVPANPLTNFLADVGLSSTLQNYSTSVAAGSGSLVVNVHEVNPGAGVGTPYTLTVSNVCAAACATPNQLPVAKAKNVSVVADNSGTASASIDNGSFDPDGDKITITQSPAGPYAVGTTTVLLTVTDTKGATSQATATVTVTNVPAFTASPLNQVVAAGQNATFSVLAIGNPAPTYQWQVSSNGGATYTNLTNVTPYSGATTAALVVTAVPLSLTNNLYRAVATNSNGTATSSAGALTVATAPVITASPSNQTVQVGLITTFTAAATGNPAPTFQWQVSTDGGSTYANLANAAPYSNVTTATLGISATTGSLSGNRYRVLATNAAASTPSSAALLTVTLCLGNPPSAGWVCVGLGWLPADNPLAIAALAAAAASTPNPPAATTPVTTPTTIPTTTPTVTTPPVLSTVPCPGNAPVAGWLCVNGGWLPADNPIAVAALAAASGTSTGAPVSTGTTTTPTTGTTTTPVLSTASCPGSAPVSGWVCVNGGWLPPDNPLAIAALSSGSTGTPVVTMTPVTTGSTSTGTITTTTGGTSCLGVPPVAGWLCPERRLAPAEQSHRRRGDRDDCCATLTNGDGWAERQLQRRHDKFARAFLSVAGVDGRRRDVLESHQHVALQRRDDGDAQRHFRAGRLEREHVPRDCQQRHKHGDEWRCDLNGEMTSVGARDRGSRT